MDVRIGVSNTPKEITLEMPEGTDHDAVQAEIEAALTGESAMLWLADAKGRRVGVPTDKVAYVDLGSEELASPMGFN